MGVYIKEFHKEIDDKKIVSRTDMIDYLNVLFKKSIENNEIEINNPRILDLLDYLITIKNPFSNFSDSEFISVISYNKLRYLYHIRSKDDNAYYSLLSNIEKNDITYLYALVLIATHYVHFSEYALAFRYYNEANDILHNKAEREGFKFQSEEKLIHLKTMIYANLALLFSEAGQYNNAEEYQQKSLEVLSKDNLNGFLVININLLRLRFLSGKTNSFDYLKSLDNFESKNIEKKSYITEGIVLYKSSCYISDKKYQKALQIINAYQEKRELVNASIIINLLICFYNLKMYDEYEVLYKKEIDKLIDSDKFDPKYEIIKNAINIAQKKNDEDWEIKCLYDKVNFNSAYYKNKNLFLLEVAQNEHQLKINEKELEYQKHKAKDQKVYNEELINKNKELEQFASIVAHDIKSPLRSMVNLIGILELSLDLDKSELEIFNNIKNTNKRLDQFVDDLVNYAKYGNSENSFYYVDINNTIKEVKLLLKESITKKNVIINVNANLPKLYAYDSACTQLFLNLISNSIKYNKPDSSPIIDIWYELKNNKVCIFIKDNGIGIKEEEFDKIFLPFKRGTTNIRTEGIGIGLATCKKIINNINATISVESELNFGATFKIEINKEFAKF